MNSSIFNINNVIRKNILDRTFKIILTFNQVAMFFDDIVKHNVLNKWKERRK